MANYKYLQHTVAELDAAVESQRQHCEASDLHVCAEDKAALAACCSDVAALNEQVGEIKETIEGITGPGDVYSKPETDSLLVAKADKADTYTKTETDGKITEKVAEIVAGAPERFDTLKELSDWIDTHEGSAAEMNTAIQQNKTDILSANAEIAKKVDKISGKSLIADSEIERLAEVDNYDDTAVNAQIADIYNRCGGGKNLAKLLNSAVEYYGVTVTPNTTDGTVTVKGTMTSKDFGYIKVGTCKVIAGKTYKLIDTSFVSGRSYCYMQYGDKTPEFTNVGTTITPTSTGTYSIYFRARKDYTYDNIHYPIAVENLIVDKTFTPYVSTNSELQEQINALTARIAALEGTAATTE